MFHQELCDGGIPRLWAAFLEIFINALKTRLHVADQPASAGAPTPCVRGPDERELVRTAGEAKDAPFEKVDVDLLSLTNASDFINGRAHGLKQFTRRIRAEALLEHARSYRKPGRAPAAISAGGPKTDDFSLENGKAQRRVRPQEIIGRRRDRSSRHPGWQCQHPRSVSGRREG